MGKPKKNFSTELLAAPGGSKGGRRTETDRDAFPGQTHSETVQENRLERPATPPAIRAVEAFAREAATSPIASPALTASDEDADLDAETAPIESSEAEDSRAEESEEELERPPRSRRHGLGFGSGRRGGSALAVLALAVAWAVVARDRARRKHADRIHGHAPQPRECHTVLWGWRAHRELILLRRAGAGSGASVARA